MEVKIGHYRVTEVVVGWPQDSPKCLLHPFPLERDPGNAVGGCLPPFSSLLEVIYRFQSESSLLKPR